MSDEHVFTCKYVPYSTIVVEVFEKDRNDDFDVEEFEGTLGDFCLWGKNNRTMCSLSLFCDCIRRVDLEDERCDAIAAEVSKIVPYDAYIDMEN